LIKSSRDFIRGDGGIGEHKVDAARRVIGGGGRYFGGEADEREAAGGVDFELSLS